MIKITEHARIRFLERLAKLDIDKVDEIILSEISDRTKNIIESGELDECIIDCKDFKLVIQNKTIITVLGKNND